MYVLYLSTITFILLTLYNCVLGYKPMIITKKLDYEKNYSLTVKNIEFFKDGKCIKRSNYKDCDFLYDFFIVNYIYNNNEFKYYSEEEFFSIYSKEQIKDYVYVNKITRAVLLITEKQKETETETETETEIDYELDILEMIIPFVGPNYNFYKDINKKLEVNKILNYLKLINKDKFEKLNLIDKNYKLLFYDNFNNEYNIDSNYLIWNPELKL